MAPNGGGPTQGGGEAADGREAAGAGSCREEEKGKEKGIAPPRLRASSA